MKELLFFDSTLRDGSHAVKQNLTLEGIEKYCEGIDSAGMHTVIVGHGNGLGASSIQMGLCGMDEFEMLKVAGKKLKHTKLGAFLTVGFGTVNGHVAPALELGVEVFCIAVHCTEADTMRQHIEYISRKGKEAYGVLMMYHRSSPEEILEEAKKIESYGADGVILMDSAGASTMEMVQNTVRLLKANLSIRIGFHAHNNLGLAVANTYIAICEGAEIIDGTIRGFGSGAGNCQLEALAALLEKNNMVTKVDLFQMLDVSENIVGKYWQYNKNVDATCIVSGYAGVVSTFKTKVDSFAREYEVDPKEIFLELGKRNAIAGRDDMILEVAQFIQERNRKYK